MKCKRCNEEKPETEFYKNDSTCKVCRRKLVKANREAKKEYYQEYDKKRYKNDPRVKERHMRYRETPQGKAAVRRARVKWEETNAIKKAASTMVGNAVRDGRLTKPDSCEQCGCKPKHLHGHHDDYAKPLEVRWLCPVCHKKWHNENGEGANAF